MHVGPAGYRTAANRIGRLALQVEDDTPEPLEVEDLVNENEQQQQNPQATPTPTPKVEQKPVVQEDLQMKKALELMQDKPAAAKTEE